MTAEKLHDALTLLSTDLIEEADKKRSGKPKRIVWKRYVAMAACFALVLCSGLFCARLFRPKGTMESTPAEAAVMQAAEDARGFEFEEAPAEAQAAAPAAEAPAAMEEGANTAEDAQADTAAESSGTCVLLLYPGISQPQYIEAIPANTTACFSGNPAPKLFRSRSDLEVFRDESIRFELDNLMDACEGYNDVWFETHDLLLISLCGVPVSDRSEVTAIREQDGQWEIVVEKYQDSTEAERMDWHILFETEKNTIASEDVVTIVYE